MFGLVVKSQGSSEGDEFGGVGRGRLVLLEARELVHGCQFGGAVGVHRG